MAGRLFRETVLIDIELAQVYDWVFDAVSFPIAEYDVKLLHDPTATIAESFNTEPIPDGSFRNGTLLGFGFRNLLHDAISLFLFVLYSH